MPSLFYTVWNFWYLEKIFWPINRNNPSNNWENVSCSLTQNLEVKKGSCQLSKFSIELHFFPTACMWVNPCRAFLSSTLSLDFGEFVLLLQPSASLGWILPLPLCHSLSAQGCLLSSSSLLFLSLILASLLLFLPPHLLSPSWICFTVHCSRPIARIQAEWVTHLQSAALKPCRRQSHPQTLLLSPGSHGCPSTGVHILSLHTFPEPRDDTGKIYTHSVTC